MYPKLVTTAIVVCITVCTCWSQNSKKSTPKVAMQARYTLTGNLKNAANQMIYLEENSFFKDSNGKDSAKADKNGNFIFKGKVSEPTYYLLRTSVNKGGIFFFIENVAMKIQGDADSLYTAVVSGSAEEDIRGLYDKVAMAYNTYDIEQEYQDAKNRGDTLAMKGAKEKEKSVLQNERQAYDELIKKYPLALATINFQLAGIRMEDENSLARGDSLIKYYESTRVAHYGQVLYFKKAFKAARSLAVGKIAPVV